MESEIDVVKKIDCERAEELLDALGPRSEHFRDRHDPSRRYQQFIFRGHEDDRFELVPTALRIRNPRFKDVLIKSRHGSGTWGVVESEPADKNKERFVEAHHPTIRVRHPLTQLWLNRDQIRSEMLMLIDFFQFADAGGLPLPEDSRSLRFSFEEWLISFSGMYRKDKANHGLRWPPPNLLSIIALAQHYGVPTRLLDWTRSAYIAAYFAAKGAVQSTNSDATHLSVWAFNSQFYRVRRKLNSDQEKVKIITAPAAGNPNLHLQKGLFTIYQPESLHPGDPVDRKPLDRAIGPYGVVPLFFRFRLPLVQANKLLQLLFLEGVSGASVYAGYKGAAEATTEHMYWDNWDRPGDIWQHFASVD